MPSISLFLRKDWKQPDETHPICYRFKIKKSWTIHTSPFSVLPDDWNDDMKMIKPGCDKYDDVRKINLELHAALDEFLESLQTLQNKYGLRHLETLKPKELKEMVINHIVFDTFDSFAGKLIAEMKANNNFGNARAYSDARRFVERVSGGTNLTFKNLDYNFMIRAENFFRRQNNGDASGFNVYARTIRAIFNKAIRAGVAEKDWYPFENYKIKKPKKKRLIAITLDDIRRVENVHTKPGTVRELAKDIFLFSFYTWGTNFSDIAKMRKENIIKGNLVFRRSKTSGNFIIPLHDKALALIKKYEGKSQFGFLFPVIKHKNPEQAYTDLRTKLRGINGHIRKIGSDLGVEINLTTYSARHSFAQIAKKELKLPTEMIKDALGHDNFGVTEQYLSRFSDEVLEGTFNRMFDDKT
jgi:integrase/recombinase XerD